MVEFLLKDRIERRVRNEVLANDYFMETVLMRITQEDQSFVLDNSIYFLVNEKLDVPITAKVIMDSPDAFFSTSQTDYDVLMAHKNQSFRNKLRVRTSEYGAQFTPYSLEFIKVTPIINSEN